MAALVLAGGLLLGANKYHKHEKKKRDGAGYEYENLPLRYVLAMLVHGVYMRDLNRLGDFAATFLGYQNGRAENYGKQHWGTFRTSETDAGELKKLGLEFLLRQDPHPTESAPRLAIVLRGTILYKGKDLVADMKISIGLLHKTNRIQRSQELIWKVMNEFRRMYGERERICLTGHSLGAAVALQVGRYLVSTHGVAIDTHLFNPPLLSLVDFATLRAFPRSSASHDQSHRDAGVSDASKTHSDLDTMWAALFSENEALDAEWKQFQKLVDWTTVHFYLNPSDFFCHRYITCYKNRHQMPTSVAQLISPQGILTRLLGKDAKYITDVVPSADLYISNLHQGNPRLAHSLRQWHKYADEKIGLNCFQARLLTPTRHPVYETGRIMLHSPRGDKQDGKAPTLTGDSMAAAVTASAGYAHSSQASAAVAGYESLMLQCYYDTTKRSNSLNLSPRLFVTSDLHVELGLQ